MDQGDLMDRMMHAHSQCVVDDMCYRIGVLVGIATDGGHFGRDEARRFLMMVIEEGMPDEGRATMDANEARRMTERALAPEADAVRPYVEHVLAKVAEAAGEGRREIVRPLGAVPPGIGRPTPDAREAVRKALEAKGFTWTHHPDPASGDASGYEYDTLSW